MQCLFVGSRVVVPLPGCSLLPWQHRIWVPAMMMDLPVQMWRAWQGQGRGYQHAAQQKPHIIEHMPSGHWQGQQWHGDGAHVCRYHHQIPETEMRDQPHSCQ